jgi:large subunit ribosomal protein L21
VYAIVATGGKQYRVQPGQVLEVERLDAPDGARIDLGNVLMIGNGEDVMIGRPTVEGARCVVDVIGTAKGKKIVVFKYKAKSRYRRKTGHRQKFSRVIVRDIVTA